MRIRRTVAAGAAAAALTLVAALPASADGPAAAGPLKAGMTASGCRGTPSPAWKPTSRIGTIASSLLSACEVLSLLSACEVGKAPAEVWKASAPSAGAFNVVTRSPGYPVGGQAAIR
ncbi:hypothetical protein [Streptomyces sioyaensis]|uniref:hypothetical protein n=1 Tax=Streptomyces sioyaensis TaxID=67364 RepID=UPI003D7423B7